MNEDLLKSILEALQGINEGIQKQNEQLDRLNDNVSSVANNLDLCVYENKGYYWLSIGGNVNV